MFPVSSKYVLKSEPKAFSTSVYKVSSKYAKTSVACTGAHLVPIAVPFNLFVKFIIELKCIVFQNKLDTLQNKIRFYSTLEQRRILFKPVVNGLNS